MWYPELNAVFQVMVDRPEGHLLYNSQGLQQTLLVHGSYPLEPYHFSACQPDFCQHLYVLPEGSLWLPEPLGLCLVRSAKAHSPGEPSVMSDSGWNMNVRAFSPHSWGGPEMCVFHPSQSPRSIRLPSPAWLLA